MLNSLLATFVICMGLGGNSNPIYDYKEKPEEIQIVQEKELQPKRANNEYFHTTNYGNFQEIDNDVSYSFKSEITLSSAQINVRGTLYGNEVRAWNNYSEFTIPCVSPGVWFDDTDNRYMSSLLYVFSIYGYNININTEAYVQIQYKIEYSDQNTPQLGNHYYSRVRTLQSQDSAWNSYVGQQLTQVNIKNIKEDIFNPNNSYQYSTNYYDRDLSNHTVNSIITEDITYTISPNTQNYIVVIITPYDVSENWTGDNDNTRYKYVMVEQTPVNPNISYGVGFSGTYIVPTGTYEVVDVGGLMFTILSLPFTFISQAFNLTLFPGTQYQINISNLFLAILAVLIFLFIIKLIIGAKMGK